MSTGNSSDIISTAEAIAELTQRRSTIDTLQARLALEVRRVLRPIGFSRKPEEWQDSAEDVLTAVNREYRHDVKMEILQNARKIRAKQGLQKLIGELVEAATMFGTAQERFAEFETLWSDKKCIVPSPEQFEYDDVLETFSNSMTVFEVQLSASRERLQTFKAVFHALDRPMEEVDRLLQPLSDAVPQTQTAFAVTLLLAALSELHDERLLLETRSGVLFAVVRSCLLREAPLTREAMETHLARYDGVRQSTVAQAAQQAELLTALKKYLGLAACVTPTLPGVAPGDEVSVKDLREAFKAFMEIHDAVDVMHELYEGLIPALSRSTAQLKARVQLGNAVIALF